MKLHDILYENVDNQVVYVDQQFSDLTFDFDIDDSKEVEDISQIPEQLRLIARVVTPTDQDYRGQSDMADAYAHAPELAYYVGATSGKVYQQDLLNEPNITAPIRRMTYAKFVKLLQAHIITPGKAPDAPAAVMH